MTTQDLDAMYGFVHMKIGDSAFAVRRILAKKQSRTVVWAVNRATKGQQAILQVDLNATEERPEEAIEREIEQLEDQLTLDMATGVRAMLWQDGGDIDFTEWSLTSLAQLFGALREGVGATLKAELDATFPQNGSKG